LGNVLIIRASREGAVQMGAGGGEIIASIAAMAAAISASVILCISSMSMLPNYIRLVQRELRILRQCNRHD